jgi:hypothetical protein
MSRIPFYALLSLIACTGCATVTEGNTQLIAIDTAPEGATCAVKSNDDVLGVVSSTPGEVVIHKSKNDVLVECSKPGYETARKKDHSDYALTGLGNLALGQFGAIGSVLDTLTGAANKYDGRVFLELEKEQSPAVASAAAAPAAGLIAAPAQAALQVASAIPAPEIAPTAVMQAAQAGAETVAPPVVSQSAAAPVAPVAAQVLEPPEDAAQEARRAEEARLPFVEQVAAPPEAQEPQEAPPVLSPAILNAPAEPAPPAQMMTAQIVVMQPLSLPVLQPVAEQADAPMPPALSDAALAQKPPYNVMP